jgi:hypothetical protein
MNRTWGRVLTLLATGLLASALVPACATNDMSVFVRAALAPSPNRQNNLCIYTDDPQQPQLLEGTLDIAIRETYFAVLLVGNQMIPRGDPLLVRAESSRFHVEGAVVRVTWPGPDEELIHEFTSVGTGFADQGQNNAPDYALAGITALDAVTTQQIAGAVAAEPKVVVAKIRVFGRTLGGRDLESGEFQLPIRVCHGCLLRFNGANDATEPAERQPNCLAPLQDQSFFPCYPGQDEPTPCQYCLDRPACNRGVE